MTSLYAMQFCTGLVKVGQATDPATRMRQHRDRLSVAGIRAVQEYSAACEWNASVAETALIARCVAAGTPAGAGQGREPRE